MREAVLVDVVRLASGKGKPGGALSATHPTVLLSTVLQALVQRSDLDPALVEDVITGCVQQSGEQAMNIGRSALLGAGFPESVPATTINRQCGSSQQAVHFAAQGVMAGAYDVVIACGVESMSRVPMGASPQGQDYEGPQVHERYPDGLVHQGISAELVASRWKLDREQLDEYSARSHQRAAHAATSGFFDREVVGIQVTDANGATIAHTVDETVRPSTTAEQLAGLKPSFQTPDFSARFPEIEWSITAGNSSPLTDGASAALIMDSVVAQRLGLIPRARFVSFAVTGDDPIMMLTAPIPATQQALKRAGLGIDDIDAYEVNEAFAPVPLAWQREIGAHPERLNARGGAIALGHALGSSGTRLLATLVNHLEATGGRYGLQTMCEAAGMANATIIERL
ncbi:acetyl-CoA acyltransferase [Branchiibius hedensis]|uniref:Acetyl-CoA acyltransferase n=1 Tax=Branchiibius hedensis TaxID=672460 RepID=A0A2Y8ZLB6_9MICO|nr:thiolase family protein [Branchiibius hedensis]PWJ23947.1 acetyl-CoA acyltransferase [Branchiibius hedensis]SSA32765.1 acetyl-CoA acyltransferase [Branchiibius hedensis]